MLTIRAITLLSLSSHRFDSTSSVLRQTAASVLCFEKKYQTAKCRAATAAFTASLPCDVRRTVGASDFALSPKRSLASLAALAPVVSPSHTLPLGSTWIFDLVSHVPDRGPPLGPYFELSFLLLPLLFFNGKLQTDCKRQSAISATNATSSLGRTSCLDLLFLFKTQNTHFNRVHFPHLACKTSFVSQNGWYIVALICTIVSFAPIV